MHGSEEAVRLRAGLVRPEALLDTHLARIFTALASERATGVLEVESDALRTGFYLREGTPIFAEAGMIGETLGRVLVRRGMIDEQEYRAILRRMTNALVDDELMRFGEVAIELGILAPEDVSAGLATQVHERLIRCLQLDHARWVFREDPEAVAAVARFPCALHSVLMEALAEPPEASRWLAQLAPMGDREVGLIEDAASIADRLSLPPAGLRIARALDGKTRLGDVLRASEPGAEARAAIVAMLLLLGLAELRALDAIPLDAAPASGVAIDVARTDRSLTEVDVAARSATVADALRAEFERRRVTMTKRSAPQQREEAKSRLTAEQHYAEGRKLLREGKLAPAVIELAAAAAAMPEALEYGLAHSLAEWLASEQPRDRKLHEDTLRASVAVTLRADKRCALAHYAQGRLHAAAGDHASALRAFQSAVKLDERDLDAQRWLRLTRQRA